jgi:hypothetical protein
MPQRFYGPINIGISGNHNDGTIGVESKQLGQQFARIPIWQSTIQNDCVDLIPAIDVSSVRERFDTSYTIVIHLQQFAEILAGIWIIFDY